MQVVQDGLRDRFEEGVKASLLHFLEVAMDLWLRKSGTRVEVEGEFFDGVGLDLGQPSQCELVLRGEGPVGGRLEDVGHVESMLNINYIIACIDKFR